MFDNLTFMFSDSDDKFYVLAVQVLAESKKIDCRFSSTYKQRVNPRVKRVIGALNKGIKTQ